MKQGSVYAARIKKSLGQWRRQGTAIAPALPEDLIDKLALSILGTPCGLVPAQATATRLMAKMAGWNEVRVSTIDEITAAMGRDIPESSQHAKRLRTVLQAVFRKENRLNLDRLKTMSRRDAKEYLEKLDGLDVYGVASMVLWGLEGHAIPVDDLLLEALREHDLVAPEAERLEVQGFLERQISAADSREFCQIVRTLVGSRSTKRRSRRVAGAKVQGDGQAAAASKTPKATAGKSRGTAAKKATNPTAKSKS